MESSGNDIFQFAEEAIQKAERENCRRELKTVGVSRHRSSRNIILNGKELINFSSNDYLGLSCYPDVVQAVRECVEKYGLGTGSSRLISGSGELHYELERKIAEFKGTESALLFSSGYLANAGILSVFADCGIPILFDKLSHASIVDAAVHYSKKWSSFRHNDVEHLEELLSKLAEISGQPKALVVTEGVFSMDGDSAPLAEIYEVCRKHNALLMVDDAHGTGTVGDTGRGSVHAAGLSGMPGIVIVGTLSKALGSQGGFVAGDEIVKNLLINKCRQFIYDTSPAYPVVAGSITALDLISANNYFVKKLHENARLLRRELDMAETESPIIPRIVGDADKAVHLSQYLFENGYFVSAIRPPTVPPGKSRLRITVTAEHIEEEIIRLANLIKAY